MSCTLQKGAALHLTNDNSQTTLFDRLSKDTGGRTLLENRGGVPLRQVIERLYKEREPFYEALARTTV